MSLRNSMKHVLSSRLTRLCLFFSLSSSLPRPFFTQASGQRLLCCLSEHHGCLGLMTARGYFELTP